MLKKRIIPCLDIKDGRTVKGINFVDIRDAGDPVELAKRYVELAAKIDCGRIRVFGDRFLPGLVKEEVIKNVTDGLVDISDFAKSYGIDVLLEMHSEFNFWKYALNAVKATNRENVGLVYNCDIRDLTGGSPDVTYSYVRNYIKHVHMHCALRGYPYKKLFKLLRQDGYTGYLSVEHDEGSSDPEKVIGYYAELFRAWNDF